MLLFVLVPSFLMAQEKIGNKIYKYGDVYQSIQGPTLIAFDEADAKTMSKTLEYFSKAGAYVKSWNTLFLPGSNVTEDEFSNTLDKNNIETLILIDIIDSSDATMSRTVSTAYASVNQKRERSGSSSSDRSSSSSNGRSSSSSNSEWNATAKAKSTSTSSAVSTTKNSNYITEMSLRLTIFSKKDGFKEPVAVVEGRATNESPDTTADQIARRIVRRMAKALDEERAF